MDKNVTKDENKKRQAEAREKARAEALRANLQRRKSKPAEKS